MASLATLCSSAHAAISRLLGALPLAGDQHSELAHQLALASAAALAFGQRLASEEAEDGDVDSAGPQKRARVAACTDGPTGRSLRLLDLPLNVLVDTAVAFVGARELSRLAVATSFIARTGFVGEVARRLQLRRPCWPHALWRRRENVHALARGWGDAPAAVAQALRSGSRGRLGVGGGAGGRAWGGGGWGGGGGS